MKEIEKKVKLYSAIGLKKEVIDLFTAIGVEVLAYDRASHNEIEFLLINEESNIVEWEKAFTSRPSVRFICWGQFYKLDEFILNRGILIINHTQFESDEKYRYLIANSLFKESTLHIQDKIKDPVAEIIKATITHPLRFGHTIDLIAATAYDRKFDLVPVRHYLNSIMLWCAYLKQLDKIGYPFQIEYICSDEKLAVNLILHTPNFYLENLLEFFQHPKYSVQKENLLWECYRATDYFEVSHFNNAQKMNIMAIWYRERGVYPAFNIYEVESIKNQWEQTHSDEQLAFNADEKINAEKLDELEQALLDESTLNIPELEAAPEALKDKEALQELIVAIIVKQAIENPEKFANDLTQEEVKALMDGTDHLTIFNQLAAEDLAKVLDAINDINNKNIVSEKIETFDSEDEQTGTPDLQSIAKQLAESSQSSNTISEVCQIVEESALPEFKKNIVNELIEQQKVNPEHPTLLQAAQVLSSEELAKPELVHQKMKEIAEFIRAAMDEQNPNIDRVIESLQNEEIDFNQAKKLVREMQENASSFAKGQDIANDIKIEGSQKQSITEIMNILSDFVDDLASELPEKIKSRAKDDFLQKISGSETEEELKKVIEEVTLTLNEEIIRVAGKSLDQDEFAQSIKDIMANIQEQKTLVKGQKDAPKEIFTIASASEEEKNELTRILADTLKKSDLSKFTVSNMANSLDDSLDFENLRVKHLIHKEKDSIALHISSYINDYAKKVGKSPDKLSADELSNNVEQIIKGATDKILEEKQVVKSSFLDSLNSLEVQPVKRMEAIVLEPQIDFMKQFEHILSQMNFNPETVNMQVIQEISQKTNVSPARVVEALEKARVREDQAKTATIVKQIISGSNSTINGSGATLNKVSEDINSKKQFDDPKVKKVASVIDGHEESENELKQQVQQQGKASEQEKAVDKKEDRAIQLKIKQKEEENKKLKAENLKLKVELETKIINDKANNLSEQNIEDVSLSNVTQMFKPNEVTEIVREAKVANGSPISYPSEPLRSEKNTESTSESDSKESKTDKLKLLKIEFDKKEDFYQKEISKLSTEKNKGAISVEMLKKQNSQQNENYQKKIKDLERQMSAAPVIKSLIDGESNLDPEIHRLKIQNEGLTKSAEAYKRTIS